MQGPTASVTPSPAPEVRRTVGDMATNDTALPRTEEEWQVRLSPDEFRVLRQGATERAWTGEYVDFKTDGMYECRACGAALHPRDYKFDSNCGWPSFDHAIPRAVQE